MSTADPAGARAHARAMAGTRVEAMPTVPPSDAEKLPPGATRETMLWEETLAVGGYSSKRLARGAMLRLEDVHGDSCVSMLIFNAETPHERLNIADTLKVQWNAYLCAGKLLLSDMGRVMMSITADDAETHDAFCGVSNATTNAEKYGEGYNHSACPNARDRFMLAVAKHGLARRDVHACINWFKGVRIGADGETKLDVGPFAPGRSIVLRAEMDVIVVFANCPHVLDPRTTYTVTPARVSAWRGAVTAEGDPVRNATPEGLRAFLNTEEYYRR